MLRGIGKGVCAFWQENTFVDYTIEVEDKEFKAHKVILASASDYFRAMLTGGMIESQTNRVRLEGQSSHAVSSLIEYIYTGKFGSTKASTEERLGCAIYLQIPTAIEASCNELCDELNEENCLDVLSTFRAYSLEEGIERTISFITSNTDEIFKACSQDEMSHDINRLTVLLEYWGKSEWKLFHAIIEWVEADSKNRKPHLNDLMNCVRFALMTPREVGAVKEMAIYRNSDDSWCSLVDEADEYHNLPIHLKVLNESEQSKVRAAPTPTCFIAGEGRSGVFHAVNGTSWIEHKVINPLEVQYGVTTSIEVNNFLIASRGSDWYVFDPRTKKWSAIAKLADKRFGPVVHCGKQLYVVGGRERDNSGPYTRKTASIERYDLATNSWNAVPSKMPNIFERYAVCSIGGCIYVTSGWRKVPGGEPWDTEFSTRLECYEPSTNTWSNKAPMLESFKDYAVMVMELWSEEVIFILNSDFDMQFYSPSTDQWSMYCPVRSTKMVHHPECAVLPRQNTLFLIDFLYEIDPHRNRWSINDGTVEGGCEVWTICEQGKETITKHLDEFPRVDGSLIAVQETESIYPAMLRGIGTGVCAFWQEDMFVDYTIEVEDKEFKAHKVILASASDYFRAMLTGGMTESQTDRVRLEGQGSLAVSTMIEYIYTGELGTSKASVKELLLCAVYLQIPEAIVDLTSLMYNEVNKENCFDILSVFQLHYLKDGIQLTVEYIKTNFEEIMKHYVPEETTYATFINLMNVWQRSEWDLFLCVEEWIQADLENRQHHQTDLMGRLHYGVMPLSELRALKKKDVYSDATICDLVDKAIAYHALPIHLKVIAESDLSRVRNDPLPMSHVSDSTISPKIFSMSNAGKWKEHKTRHKPDFKYGVHAHLTVNNFLIVCDAADSCSNQSWYIFDPRTFKWSTMACMLTPRSDFAVVYHDTQLFALGGLVGPCDDHEHCESAKSSTDEIECYDFKTNTWSVLPYKLPIALHEHSAGVIEGRIYVGGGTETSDSKFSTRLDCLDLSTGAWSRKATMMEPYDAHQMFDVMELYGEKVLYMMGRHLNMQYYSPTTDRWALFDWTTCVTSGLIRSTSTTMLTHGNTIYLIDAVYAGDWFSNYSDDVGMQGGCVRWTPGKKGEKFSEVMFDTFPFYKEAPVRAWGSPPQEEEEPTMCTALLSIPAHMIK